MITDLLSLLLFFQNYDSFVTFFAPKISEIAPKNDQIFDYSTFLSLTIFNIYSKFKSGKTFSKNFSPFLVSFDQICLNSPFFSLTLKKWCMSTNVAMMNLNMSLFFYIFYYFFSALNQLCLKQLPKMDQICVSYRFLWKIKVQLSLITHIQK